MTYPPSPGSGYPGDYPPQGQQQPPYPGYGAQQPSYPAFGGAPSPYGSAPPPFGPSPYGPQNDKTNGMAIASMITGLLGCTSLLGLIFGIISLRQISQRGERGRGMAFTGIAAFGVWSVISVLVIVLSPNSGSPSSTGGSGVAAPSPTRSAPEDTGPKSLSVVDMKVGDCINDSNTQTLDPQTSQTVTVRNVDKVPCDRPHDAEVLAKFKVSGVIRPSDEEMKNTASTGCRSRIGDKLDRGDEDLNLSYYFPTVTSWAAGNHTITCAAVSAKTNGKLTHRIG